MNAALFITTVLIWGTTWIAIAWQVGPVPVVVSVFYRFALGGALFLLGLAVAGKLKPLARRHQPWVMAQALCLFSLNFICFYISAAYIPSGLISVVFSLAVLFNTFNARLFLGDRVTSRALLASAIGFAGLVLLFGAELSMDDPWRTLSGISYAALGTMFFSLGNMVSRRNTAAGLSTVDANAWGMGYGALFLLGIILVTGTPIVAPPNATYLVALVYLAIFASIIAFTTYLMLVARLGASQAAYATVLFPIVALTVSTFAEGYSWTWVKVLGVLLALSGNVVMFWKGSVLPAAISRLRVQDRCAGR